MILIQKPYIPIFVNYLNLSKFEYVFGLNLNFEFKFKLAEKNLKSFSIPACRVSYTGGSVLTVMLTVMSDIDLSHD
jgi:hypothetical protein